MRMCRPPARDRSRRGSARRARRVGRRARPRRRRPGGAPRPRRGAAVTTSARRSARARGSKHRAQRPAGAPAPPRHARPSGSAGRRPPGRSARPAPGRTPSRPRPARGAASVAARARARTRGRRGPRRCGPSGPAHRAGPAPRRPRPPARRARRRGRSRRGGPDARVAGALRAGGLDLLLEALGQRRPCEAIQACDPVAGHLAGDELAGAPPATAPGSSLAAEMPAPTSSTMRAASVSAPSTSTGLPAARYSNSFVVATLRDDAPSANTSRLSAARCSPSARGRSSMPTVRAMPSSRGSASSDCSSAVTGPAKTTSSRSATSGQRRRSSTRPSTSARGDRPETPARPGVHERVAAGGQQPVGVRKPVAELVGIEAVGHDRHGAPEALGEVVRDRPGDRDEPVRAREHRTLQRGVGGRLRARRPRAARRVVRPAVAEVGDPRHAQAPQRQADEMARRRGRRGDHAVEADRAARGRSPGGRRTASSRRAPDRQRRSAPAGSRRSPSPACCPWIASKCPRRQFSRLASRSRVRTTRVAPGTPPLPDASDVSTVTRWPRRSRYLARLAGRRAPDKGARRRQLRHQQDRSSGGQGLPI